MTQWTWEGFEKRKRKTYWANVGAAASEPLSPPASNVSLWEETCAESPRRNKWAETPRGNKWGILAVWDGSEWSKNTNLYLSLSEASNTSQTARLCRDPGRSVQVSFPSHEVSHQSHQTAAHIKQKDITLSDVRSPSGGNPGYNKNYV